MKGKPIIYKGMCIVGLLLSFIVMLLHSNGVFSSSIYFMLHGFTNAVFIIGLIMSLRLAVEKCNPEIKRINAIENKDERLLLIKRQSSSVSGEILQWLLLVASFVFIGLGAPIWIGISLMFLVVIKLFIEFILSIYYQDKY